MIFCAKDMLASDENEMKLVDILLLLFGAMMKNSIVLQCALVKKLFDGFGRSDVRLQEVTGGCRKYRSAFW